MASVQCTRPCSQRGFWEKVFLPVFVSRAADPTHAVVWLHGLRGDANTYYCSGLAATAAARAAGKTLSVAPWFGDEQVTLEQWLGSSAAARLRERYPQVLCFLPVHIA